MISIKQLNTLTTSIDLRNVLKACGKCDETIRHGKNIVCHSELSQTVLNRDSKNGKKPIGFIVNSSCEENRVGHWVSCLVTKTNHVLVCDGMNYVLKQKDFLHSLDLFCDLNRLKLIDLGIRYQLKNSLSCGLLSVFWISAHTNLKPNEFRKLCHCLKRNTIKTNEMFMLSYIRKHFKIQFNTLSHT